MTRASTSLLLPTMLACALGTPALGEGELGAFDKLRAGATLRADASGKVVGESFDVPAATSRSASSDLLDSPLVDSISIAPTVGFVSGSGSGSYTAGASKNVLTASSSGVASVKLKKQDEAQPNNMLLTTASTVTFDFTLVRTVAAELGVALQRADGFTHVRTSLSGPLTHPQIDLQSSGDASRKLILPPGDYRLTFIHLTGAATTDEAEEVESKASASFSLAVDPCGADCNGDNTLDVLDFICFQQIMADEVDRADVNNDGRIDVLDMVVFQELFVGGCE